MTSSHYYLAKKIEICLRLTPHQASGERRLKVAQPQVILGDCSTGKATTTERRQDNDLKHTPHSLSNFPRDTLFLCPLIPFPSSSPAQLALLLAPLTSHDCPFGFTSYATKRRRSLFLTLSTSVGRFPNYDGDIPLFWLHHLHWHFILRIFIHRPLPTLSLSSPLLILLSIHASTYRHYVLPHFSWRSGWRSGWLFGRLDIATCLVVATAACSITWIGK